MNNKKSDINRHLQSKTKRQGTYPQVVCKDGFSVSIQAGKHFCCSPHEDFAFPYDKMNLGYPTADMPTLEAYCEKPGTLKTVWGYVPVDLINDMLDSHGGIIDQNAIVFSGN